MRIYALALLLLLFAAAAHAQQVSNYSAAYADQIIAQSLSYVNAVNQSGYIIFYPNLTQAYSYIAKAQKIYLTSPGSAVLYANEAAASANGEYQRISRYRFGSLLVLLIFSGATAYALLKMLRVSKR